jgi:hypothetical protein
MIIVPTHKRHKNPSKKSKTIYVFTYGRVIVTVQIHSRKRILKGLKWPLQKGHQYRSAAGFDTIMLQDLVKRDVCRCWVDMPLPCIHGGKYLCR